MREIKVGIIGTGGISNEHMKGYKALPNVTVSAVCDLDYEKALAYARKYDVPEDQVYTDYNEMLAKADLEAVSVTTWNSAHAPATIAALNAGKHVICEKPLAMNARQAEEMLEAAERNHKLLQVGFVRRFGNDCEIVQDFVNDGKVGEIYFAKASYLRRHGFPGRWFGDTSYSGGGPLIDLGVHVIDLSRYLMGNHLPVCVYGATFHKLGKRDHLKLTEDVWASTSKGEFKYDVEDLATAMIRFDNGAVLSVEASFDLNITDNSGDIQLFGDKGGLKLSDNVTLVTEVADRMVDIVPYGVSGHTFGDAFAKEIEHFVRCITEGIECRAPGKDGVVLMKILDAIYESARTGHEVPIQW